MTGNGEGGSRRPLESGRPASTAQTIPALPALVIRVAIEEPVGLRWEAANYEQQLRLLDEIRHRRERVGAEIVENIGRSIAHLELLQIRSGRRAA